MSLLEARALTKTFGGVVALDRLDLAVERNEILGLIGPNGSGKTTFFNVVTGIYGADHGDISFDGAPINTASPQAVYHAGISRTFQRSRLSLPLSIFDNIMVGGFVAPNNYTFADSLILVSILLLGGIGNPWGIVAATIIVVVVPEKLQTIQEYRFLLYAAMVIAVLLFRPEGLLPRPVRKYFPGGTA